MEISSSARNGCFVLLIILAFSSNGQPVPQPDSFTPPAIKPESAKWGASYPGKAVHSNRSGAVELHFIVDTSGKPSEFVVGAHTHPLFIRQAIKALKKIRYEPATVSGKAVPSASTRVFTFSGRYKNSRVIDQFDKYYTSFSDELLKEEPNQKIVKERLDTVARTRQPNPTAQAVLNYAQMLYAEKYLTLNDKISAAYTADMYRLGGLSIPRKLEIKRKLISWLVEARRYGDAAKIITSLSTSKFAPMVFQGGDASIEEMTLGMQALQEFKLSRPQLLKLIDLAEGPFAQTLRDIERIKASNETFASQVEISDTGNEFRWLLGDRFTLDQIQGQIDELVFRCASGFHRINFSADQDYQVPPSWGQCLIQINGSNGTRAQFIEG